MYRLRPFLLLFFCVGFTLVTHCSNNPVSSMPANISTLENKVSAIMPDVERLRGLQFIRPVHVAQTTRSVYETSTTDQIHKSFSSVELEALSKEYAQMGLLTEADTPLINILIDFYAGFPAAYYVTGTDSLYVISDAYSDDTTLNIYLSHELTHALQDQNLDMQPTIFPAYSSYNSDANSAQTALIEGDATFTEYSYIVYKYIMPGTSTAYDTATAFTASDKADFLLARTPTQKPIFLSVKNTLSYDLGGAFVASAYASSGWTAVNGLYSISSVPRSTAEINSGRASITYFEFNGLQNLLAAQSPSIVFADDDNGGFALLLGLFYGALDSTRLSRSLDWSGDRYTYVKRTSQTYGTLVWTIAFANADGANYIFGKLDSLIRQRRLGGKTAQVDSLPDSTGGGITYSYTSSVLTTNLYRLNNQIWWLDNTGLQTQQIIDMLKTQSTSPGLKKIALGSFPVTLSVKNKTKATKGILRYLFRHCI